MSIARELIELETLFRSGTLSLEEFETAKRLVLTGKSTGASEPLEEIKNQNEIAQLDREWTLDRERYMVSNRRGPAYVPTKGGSAVGGIVIVLFGTFWTAMAVFITSLAPSPISFFAMFFPVFGILFIVLGAASAISSFTKADQYAQAEADYQRRRQELISKSRDV